MENDKLVIDRRFWDRGIGTQETVVKVNLIGPRGMCCLGFYGVHLGIDPEILWDWGDPAECLNEQDELRHFDEDVFGGILEYDGEEDHEPFIASDVAGHLMKINDAKYRDEGKRELEIVEYFAKINVDVSFIN